MILVTGPNLEASFWLQILDHCKFDFSSPVNGAMRLRSPPTKQVNFPPYSIDETLSRNDQKVRLLGESLPYKTDGVLFFLRSDTIEIVGV